MSDKPITKEGFAWIITRLVGCWFVWLAFKGANAFAYAVYLLNSEGLSVVRSSGASRITWDVVWPNAIGVFFYVGLAYYFLRKGQQFVEIICLEPVKRKTDESLDDYAFNRWLAADESRRYLSNADQLREFSASLK